MSTWMQTLLIYMLTPRDALDWLTKTCVWCCVITGFSYGVEVVMGTLITSNPLEYLLIVSIVSTPFLSAAMVLTVRASRLQEDLARLAATDLLTNLDNRRAFFEKVNAAGPGTLLMMDIDHFKRVNDTYGHGVGDRVLVAVADHLRASVRRSDILGRLGGEEFAVYLVEADESRIHDIGQRISSGMTVSDGLPETISVTLSIGVANSQVASDISELLNRADEALYRAKNRGRACMVFWRPESARG